jgi:REP element-mobilizing transposase RayT
MERYRITSEASIYYVTYSIVDWLPVFVSESACRIVTESLTYCHRAKGLRINAFVIMPTHIHLIVFDNEYDSDRLAITLTDFRKFTGRALSDFCCDKMPACFAQTLRSSAINDRERRFWQPSRHPVSIENEYFWNVKLNYLHENPVRKGLVTQADHWRFSSARYYLTDGLQLCDVPITWIEC